MDVIKTDLMKTYLREMQTHRKLIAIGFVVIVLLVMVLALLLPKSYTSSSTIYTDDSNILRPLMAGTAVTTEIEDQARLAQETLFRREFSDEVLLASGLSANELTALSEVERSLNINRIKSKTVIANDFLGTTNLVRISHTSSSPLVAFNLAQKYTNLFIQESTLNKQQESRGAFNFIEREASEYLLKLVEAEERLSDFRSDNNEGTLIEANVRASRYREKIESLGLEFHQLKTEKSSIESALAGESEVVRDLSEVNVIRSRISALQVNLDNLRAVYHEAYPNIVQTKAQIEDLMLLLNNEQSREGVFVAEKLDQKEGVTSLHQQLRSQLSTIATNIETNITQVEAFTALQNTEEERIARIMGTESELAELTRDYNITQKFYNDMLQRMESARVSMHLDEEEQGVTFKIQEAPVMPLEADGLRFVHYLIGSFILGLAIPFGLLIAYVELDTRIRSESEWHDDWPPLLMVIPPLQSLRKDQSSNKSFITKAFLIALGIYIIAILLKLTGVNFEFISEMVQWKK